MSHQQILFLFWRLGFFHSSLELAMNLGMTLNFLSPPSTSQMWAPRDTKKFLILIPLLFPNSINFFRFLYLKPWVLICGGWDGIRYLNMTKIRKTLLHCFLENRHGLILHPTTSPIVGASLPRQGSFFTRNSSRAIHPPPTRTITVLRRIRTSRNCWESPNWNQGDTQLTRTP